MSHVKPLPREELSEFEPFFEGMEKMAGFVPNSLLTMAHRPEILKGYMALGNGIMMSGTVDARLKRLVALVSSVSSGCRYCQAHMAVFSAAAGADRDELEAVWEFETNDRFSDADKAALRLARDAGQVPNAVTAEHFDELRQHFEDGEIVELVAAIAMFGYLNRWNDTMATELEQKPLETAKNVWQGAGWDAGKHGPESE